MVLIVIMLLTGYARTRGGLGGGCRASSEWLSLISTDNMHTGAILLDSFTKHNLVKCY